MFQGEFKAGKPIMGHHNLDHNKLMFFQEWTSQSKQYSVCCWPPDLSGSQGTLYNITLQPLLLRVSN